MLGFRRVIYGLQWVFVFLIPIVTIAMSSGWEFFAALAAGVLGLLATLTTALISTLARDLRASRAVPPTYAVLIVVYWVVALIFPLGLQHSGDTVSSPSVLETIGLSQSANTVIDQYAIFSSVGLWIAAFITLLARNRSIQTEVAA